MLHRFRRLLGHNILIIKSKVTAIWWIGGFCLLVKLHREGCARSLQSRLVYIHLCPCPLEEAFSPQSETFSVLFFSSLTMHMLEHLFCWSTLRFWVQKSSQTVVYSKKKPHKRNMGKNCHTRCFWHLAFILESAKLRCSIHDCYKTLWQTRWLGPYGRIASVTWYVGNLKVFRHFEQKLEFGHFTTLIRLWNL